MARKAAMSVLVNPRTSVRYLFMNDDDGPLKKLVKNATDASRRNRRPLRRTTSRTLPRTTSDRGRERRVASGLAEAAGDGRREEDQGAAEREGDAPTPRGHVAQRKGRDRERESEAARERQHRRRVGAGALGRLFDNRKERDRRSRADESSLEDLGSREQREIGRDRRERADERRTHDPDQDRSPPASPIRDRDREQSEERPEPRPTRTRRRWSRRTRRRCD